MRAVWKLVALGMILAIVGCASQDAVEEVPEETQAQEAVEPVQPEAEPAPVVQEEPSILDREDIAGFVTGTGEAVPDGQSVTLATGGSMAGRLMPTSPDSSVTLYMTRDGSRPSAENNWGGPISPGAPVVITRKLEGTSLYKLVAELDGEYSEVFTANVTWQHEEAPDLSAPAFEVDGRTVSGSIEMPVSDGTSESGRLYIVSDYTAATLYISRDGTDPTTDVFWKSQAADGTYLFSPQPTAAAYRVIAVWQDAVSPVAALNVTWLE